MWLSSGWWNMCRSDGYHFQAWLITTSSCNTFVLFWPNGEKQRRAKLQYGRYMGSWMTLWEAVTYQEYLQWILCEWETNFCSVKLLRFGDSLHIAAGVVYLHHYFLSLTWPLWVILIPPSFMTPLSLMSLGPYSIIFLCINGSLLLSSILSPKVLACLH